MSVRQPSLWERTRRGDKDPSLGEEIAERATQVRESGGGYVSVDRDESRITAGEPVRGIRICHIEMDGKTYPESSVCDSEYLTEEWEPLSSRYL